jgi:hypothetical protein
MQRPTKIGYFNVFFLTMKAVTTNVFFKDSFILIIDNKSCREFRNEASDAAYVEADSAANTRKRGFSFADLPGNGSQTKHMEKIVNEAKAWPHQVLKGSLLEAFQKNNYIYVYLNTAKAAPSFAVD